MGFFSFCILMDGLSPWKLAEPSTTLFPFLGDFSLWWNDNLTLNFVWSLMHWVFSNVKRWSSHNLDSSILVKANSYNNIFNHNSSQHSWAKGPKLDFQTIGCFFLLFNETKFPWTSMQYPILDLLSVLDLAHQHLYMLQHLYVHNVCAKYTVLMLPLSITEFYVIFIATSYSACRVSMNWLPY